MQRQQTKQKGVQPIMQKRIVSLGVLLLMAFSFFGCGNNYNAVIVDSGLKIKGDFLKENMTYGAYYYDNDGKLLQDLLSPVTRTFIIKEQEVFEETFADISLEIDFEKEMFLLHAYTSSVSWQHEIIKVQVVGQSVEIQYRLKDPHNQNNTGLPPQRRFLIIKMKKLDIVAAEFKQV